MLNIRLSFYLKILLLAIGLAIYFSACVGDGKDKYIPDISNVEVDLKVKRFEQDMFAVDTNMLALKAMERLDQQYPDFFKDIYISRILPALQVPEVFSLFVRTPEILHVYDTIMAVHQDFPQQVEKLEEAFKFYKYHFPNRPVPEIVTYISEYSVGNFVAENQVGIGLDFFMGTDYPRYSPHFFPYYLRRTMNKEHLVSKTMLAVADDLVGEPNGDRLLDYMINNGKKLYVLDLLMPHAPDSIRLQYTGTQVDWLNKNELQLWSHFVGEDLLYSTKYKDFRKLVDHSPNAPGMPPEAPGRTANWIGWQIVKSYMKRHPDTTPEQLLAIKDPQKLLNGAKYKPR